MTAVREIQDQETSGNKNLAEQSEELSTKLMKKDHSMRKIKKIVASIQEPCSNFMILML
jgi:hypothetical protein